MLICCTAILLLPSLASGDEGPARPAAVRLALPPRCWDQERYVVHEWGTFVAVAGSDGRALGGLRHDPFDLPSFVYDLTDHIALSGLTPKMETPVLYFYAPKAWSIRVRVDFPHGLLTQWYPAPTMANLRGRGEDPRSAPLDTPAQLAHGLLDWGRFGELEVLAPAQDFDTCSNEGRASSLTCFPAVEPGNPWLYAREVAANAVRVSNYSHEPEAGANFQVQEEYERFLFYRGLGDFDLPLIARLTAEENVEQAIRLELFLENREPEHKLTRLAVIAVASGRLAYSPLADLGQEARAETIVLPWRPLAEAAAEVVHNLANDLQATGLYWDEALAMVHTWQASWLAEDGVRLLYVLPRAVVERELPLSITAHELPGGDAPTSGQRAPDEITRSFVGRVELLSPERERGLLATLAQLESPHAALRAIARSEVASWNRYQELYVERARQLGARVPAPEVLADLLQADN